MSFLEFRYPHSQAQFLQRVGEEPGNKATVAPSEVVLLSDYKLSCEPVPPSQRAEEGDCHCCHSKQHVMMWGTPPVCIIDPWSYFVVVS